MKDVLTKTREPTQVLDSLADFVLQEEALLFPQGQSTTVEEVDISGRNIPRFTNEFWTAKQRRGHSLHEISYRACYKSQLPQFFISLLTQEADVVYDPFMGRGTTLLEAALMGRAPAGNDANPLARILIEPRLDPPRIDEIKSRLHQVRWRAVARADIDLSMFYSPPTESMIVALKDYLDRRRNSGAEDTVDKWIRMVATNRLTGHSAGFFSVYTLPPNQAVTQESQRKINAQRNQHPPDRNVPGIIMRKSKSLLRNLTASESESLKKASARVQYFCQDAGEQIPLPADSINLVVTSPPFLDTVQYAKDNWLRCWFNNIDAESVAHRITTARDIGAWSEVMRRVLIEVKRLIAPGAWIAWEVGEVRKGTVLLDEIIAPIGLAVGLECHAIVVNRQTFTKTANCWGIRNNRAGTNTNRIVLFRKPAW